MSRIIKIEFTSYTGKNIRVTRGIDAGDISIVDIDLNSMAFKSIERIDKINIYDCHDIACFLIGYCNSAQTMKKIASMVFDAAYKFTLR